MTSNVSKEKAELGLSKQEIAELVYDTIRFLKDPEKDNTLEDLSVISEELIKVENFGLDKYLINLEFTPTVPHCSLATLIGLCIRVKLQRSLPFPYKITISLTKGSHDSEEEVNKQINDKERVAAALENPNLLKIVEECILDT